MMQRLRRVIATLSGLRPRRRRVQSEAASQEELRAQERLREISAETRAILHTASDAIVSTAKDGTILSFNASAERMFGYSAEEVIGRNVNTLTLDPSDPRHSEELAHYLVTRAMPEMGETHQGVGLRKDGSTFPLSVTLSETTVAGELRVTGFIRDFTREKAMEQRLRAAASEAVLAEQRERRGLARDLHDGLGQLLSLANMKLGALRSVAEGQGLAAPLREVEELIGEADRRTTSLTFQLSPPVLEDVGLVAAAQWLAEDIERRYELRVDVEHDGRPLPLDEAGRVTLFRALRELLINVAKHAGCENARVSIASEEGCAVVAVDDTGRGFDPEAETGGYGLLSLRERLEHLGGTLAIESAPGAGARVVVTASLVDRS